MFSYNFARDTNLLNLRFCIYLLSEELETIINNLDESHGNNYINSIDAKLAKRNEIINYLLKEKGVTQKLFSRLLSIFQNISAECGDLLSLTEVISDFKEKARFVSKIKSMQSDLKIIDEFKSYVKSYFTDKDISNLISLQRDVPNPMTRDQYVKITDFVPVFDRVDRYQQLLDEYRSLSNDMNLKEENYNRLLKKYDQLLKDFTDLTVQGTKQIVNPLGPEDYDQIFSRYKEVKEQNDKSNKDKADLLKINSDTKKPKSKVKLKSKSKKKSRVLADEEPIVIGKAATAGQSKTKSSVKSKKKVIFEAETDAVSFEEPKRKQKARMEVDSPLRSPTYVGKSRPKPFYDDKEPNISIDSLRQTDNNSFKQQADNDMDISKISKTDEISQIKLSNLQKESKGAEFKPVYNQKQSEGVHKREYSSDIEEQKDTDKQTGETNTANEIALIPALPNETSQKDSKADQEMEKISKNKPIQPSPPTTTQPTSTAPRYPSTQTPAPPPPPFSLIPPPPASHTFTPPPPPQANLGSPKPGNIPPPPPGLIESLNAR